MIDCDSDDNDSYDKVDYNDCFANRAIAHQLVLYTPWSVIGAVECIWVIDCDCWCDTHDDDDDSDDDDDNILWWWYELATNIEASSWPSQQRWCQR